MNNLPAGLYNIKLLNSLGQTVISRQVNHGGGSSTQTLNIPITIGKMKGVYHAEITKPDNAKQTHKVIIN